MTALAPTTPTVEIIPPGDTINVFVRPSPFLQARDHYEMLAGQTVEEIVEECGSKSDFDPAHTALHVALNGEGVPRDLWKRIRVKRGVTLTIVRVPTGKAIGKIIGALVSIFAILIAPAIASGVFGLVAGTTAYTTGVGLIASGIAIGGGVSIAALARAPSRLYHVSAELENIQ